MEFRFDFTGDRAAAVKFDAFPEAARAKLRETITSLTEQLYAQVQAAAPARTGKLRSEIQQFVDETPARIAGKVRVVYNGDRAFLLRAIALEYGAHKATAVKAHRRQLDHVFGRLVAPREVVVSAYTRTPNVVAHSYLRGPMAAMQPQVLAALNAAVAEAAAE